jgi:N-acyl-D-aspartate/D-glutamate deacylase
MAAMSSSSCLIRKRIIVDDIRAATFKADFRVEDGLIPEMGANLNASASEATHIANDCIVTPRFIECHTHFDGAVWWDSSLAPLPAYGVTTIITESIGFSEAPVLEDEASDRKVVGIFSFFEDAPEQSFLTKLP